MICEPNFDEINSDRKQERESFNIVINESILKEIEYGIKYRDI